MGNLNTIFLVMFIGWLMVWILLPTKSFELKWTPKLQSHLNSTTYFREQGTNILLYTFPIMFIAALSCVYLHLHKKSRDSNSGQMSRLGRRLASWRSPSCVKAPLGIVSLVEITFAAMFIVLLIWSAANYLYVSFNGHLNMRAGEEIWHAKLRSVAKRLAYSGNVCWAFLFFPVARGSSLLPLVGLTSEASIKYHIWLGHLSNVLFSAHTILVLISWITTNEMFRALEWSRTYVSNVAGEIAMVVALVMWAASVSRVRRKMFEVFFYTHHLYALYIIFYALHVGAAYFCTILPGIFLFLIDRYLRFLQSRNRVRLLSSRLLPGGNFEVTFAKTPGLHYNPTSIMFLNVPSISKLQWHPFTVSSNSNMETDRLSIMIRTEGSWTKKLFKQLSSPYVKHLDVSVEGPYGPSSFSFLRHEALIMVSGGSGITPFISIIREIMFQSTVPHSHIPRVVLVCAFKTSADLAILDLLLPISGSHAEQITQIQLQIEAYVTQESHQPVIEAQKTIKTTFFAPNPLDMPISATLGPNSWLWLGAIISSSFALFLIVLGLVTRYYIYPVDNSGGFYHFSYRCLWDMFLACACIWLASSLAFVLSKSCNGGLFGSNKIQNVEMATPTSSPAAWCYAGEDYIEEVESLPIQSLAQAIKVHFGVRPDLKKILFDSKASDVGVLVCGPRKLRHEVAKICASGLADNLHFESISFNW